MPAATTDRPAGDPAAGEPLDPELVDRILDRPTDGSRRHDRDRALAELLYATGLPLATILAARAADVDLTDRQLRLPHGRAVPFGRAAAAALAPLIVDRPGTERLFVDADGRRLSAPAAERALRQLADRAAVPGVEGSVTFIRSMRAAMLGAGADPEVTAGLTDPGERHARDRAPGTDPGAATLQRVRRRVAARRRVRP